MNFQLTRELEDLIQKKIESGRYSSASDVMREALQLLEHRDEILSLRTSEIRRQIDEGLESLRRGETVDGEEAFRRLDERHEGYRRGRSAVRGACLESGPESVIAGRAN